VKLRGSPDVDDELTSWTQTRPAAESEGLLGGSDEPVSSHGEVVSVMDFLTLPEYRPSLRAVIGVMAFQQFSGINAIVFYGVSILSASMPQYSKLINCFISVLNLVVTVGISPFVDRFGRRPLLLLSLLGMSVFSALLGISTLGHIPIGSSLSAALFVASFGIGLGPIPFLIISELAPAPAVGVAQSSGATANWIATFLVVFIFPYLDSSLGDYTFFVFTITGALGVLFIYRCVPETKHRASYREVWAGFHYPNN
jgi:SP family facilitated glucose transporter-like MFS transporter 1